MDTPFEKFGGDYDMTLPIKPDYKISFWMDGGRIQAIKRTAEHWWALAENYVRLPQTTFDVLTCEIGFVHLIAFQRGIDRFAGEKEHFYRLRVHHALRNTRAAGTPVGMNKIFRNLELPEAEYCERLPEYQWDMTLVRFPARDYATLRTEINFVLRAYWRTCRRFAVTHRFESENNLGLANGVSLHAEQRANVNAQPVRFDSGNRLGLANGVSLRSGQSASLAVFQKPMRQFKQLLTMANGFSFHASMSRGIAV